MLKLISYKVLLKLLLNLRCLNGCCYNGCCNTNNNISLNNSRNETELNRESTLEADNIYINYFIAPFTIILVLVFGFLLVKNLRNKSDKYSVADSDTESVIHQTHFIN